MTDTALELAERQINDNPTIAIPLTGIVIDLTDPTEVVQALEDVRDLKRELDNIRALLEGVLCLEAQHQGTKTLHLGKYDAVISGGTRNDYDTELLQQLLRDAGLPEDRLIEAVQEIVTYKVNQLVLKQLAAANPAYAKAIEHTRTVVETAWRVTTKPAGGHL